MTEQGQGTPNDGPHDPTEPKGYEETQYVPQTPPPAPPSAPAGTSSGDGFGAPSYNQPTYNEPPAAPSPPPPPPPPPPPVSPSVTPPPPYSPPPPSYTPSYTPPPAYAQQPPPPPPPAYGPPPSPPMYGQPGYPAQQGGFEQLGGPGAAPYGQPYSGAYPAGAPSPHRANRTPLFVGLGIVAAAGVVVLVLALSGVFGSSGGGSDAASPTSAVEGYLKAVKANDPKAAEPYVCKAEQGSLKTAESRQAAGSTSRDGALDTYTILGSSPSGSALDKATSATVNVQIKVDITGHGSTTLPSEPFKVVKEGGAWKVCGNT